MPVTRSAASASSGLGTLTQASAIKLLIPERLDGCPLWPRPEKKYLVLHRAGAEGIPQPPGAQDTPVDLLLDKFIRETGTPFPGCVPDDILVAYYYAKYPRTRIVVKIVDGAEYPRGKRDVIDEAKSFTMAAAAQGVALPYFVGLFTDGTTYCLVYKVAGRAVKFKQLKDPKVKDEIVAVLKVVQATKVSAAMPDHGWIRGATDGSNKFTTLWHAETFEGLEARKARGDTLQKLWKNWTFEQVWERIKKADIRQTLEWYLN